MTWHEARSKNMEGAFPPIFCIWIILLSFKGHEFVVGLRGATCFRRW